VIVKGRPLRIHAPAIMYFNSVRKAGSIRAAARSLNLASSALNRHILNLEGEVGGALFERHPSGLRLTFLGELFSRHVLTVIQDQERLRSDIQSLQGGLIGTIKVAGIEALNISFLPDVIHGHRKAAPRVNFIAHTAGSFEVQEMLIRGDADVGIAFALSHSVELRQVALARFRLGAIVSADHRLADKKRVSLASCVEDAMILPTPDLSIRQLLEPSIARLPHLPQATIQSNSVELMRACAARNAGIWFHTRLGLEQSLDSGKIVFIPLESQGSPIWSDLGLYVRADRALPAYLDAFLQRLEAELKEQEAVEDSAYS